jgi:predicted nuclease with TOPRIM domain
VTNQQWSLPMTQTLLAKLDELQVTVSSLAKALEQSRHENNASKEEIENLRRDNERLQKKVVHAQGQINQMLNQWFPELELNTED